MTSVVIHNHLPARDASEVHKAFMERKAARIAQAKAGQDRMTVLLERAVNARKVLKKKGETPHYGYAAQAEHLAKRARASFGLIINQIESGAGHRFEELMVEAKEPERIAKEAVETIERQVAER
jgi:hypothetical protein